MTYQTKNSTAWGGESKSGNYLLTEAGGFLLTEGGASILISLGSIYSNIGKTTSAWSGQLKN